jgi:transcriptional regulator GlxA family with amidase domain
VTARASTRVRRRSLFEEAAAIVALEHPQGVELADLARRVATSPRQLQRAFAEAGQPGVRAYVHPVRMDRAARLLEEGLTVRAAARAVGYRQAGQLPGPFAPSAATCPQQRDPTSPDGRSQVPGAPA